MKGQKPELRVVMMEADALACMERVAERTGVPVSEVISNAARKDYLTGFDTSAPHLRWEIQEGRKQIAAL